MPPKILMLSIDKSALQSGPAQFFHTSLVKGLLIYLLHQKKKKTLLFGIIFSGTNK